VKRIDHSFGGYHTDLKLSAVESYLKAFSKALANKFELWYIDAFAGTGYRTITHAARPRDLFGNEAQAESKELGRGSAQIALTVKPEFDFLVFIEKRPDFAQELEELRAKHPRRAIQVVNGEANAAISELLKSNTWRTKRAVLFLDPYGTQVEWSTLEAIAATASIDVWYLFPLAGFIDNCQSSTGAWMNKNAER
jgi:three-Cys-motif partner protein